MSSKIDDGQRYRYWDSEWERTSLEGTKARLEKMLANPSHLEAYYPLVRLARRNSLRNLKGLEVGCGCGSYSLILKKVGIISEVTLLDISQTGLDLARKLFASFGEKCQTIRGNAMNLPFADGEFDLVLSGGLLEHFKPDEQQKIVAEQCRVGKKVLCQVPASTPAYWTMRMLLTLRYLGWRWGWEEPMSFSKLQRLFAAENFKIVDKDFHNLFSAGFLLFFPRYYDSVPRPIKDLLRFAVRHEIAILCQKSVSLF